MNSCYEFSLLQPGRKLPHGLTSSSCIFRYNRSEDKETVRNADKNAARVQRHLAGSIYIWACGQKEEDEEDDLVWSDRFIGWLILFVSTPMQTRVLHGNRSD